MLPKKIPIVLVVALLIMVLAASTVSASSPLIKHQASTWELSKAAVVDPGQTSTTAEGILTSGFILEAQAKAKQGGLLPVGTFRLTLTAFSPSVDLPGQQVGKWYVQGKWTITQMGADPRGLKARHNPAVIAGTITSVLDFDPTASPGSWLAKASLPMSLAAGQWGRGEGNFSLDALNNGYLFLDLRLWPQVK